MRLTKLLRCATAAGAAVVAFGQAARAQGCVMCYTSASALNGGAARALDKAILVLFIPPALIFVGIFVFIYRRRKAWRQETEDSGHPGDFPAGSPFHPIHASHHRG